MVDSSSNEWLGLLMDWELADSSCSLQNEGSSTLSYEGGASDCECTNTQNTHIHNSANIFYHSTGANYTHDITITSPSLPLNNSLLKVEEGHTLVSIQDCSPSPLSATSTTSKSQYIHPSKLAFDTPNYLVHTKSQVIKDSNSPSYFISYNNSVGSSYNTITKSLDIKEERIWPHESLMMGTNNSGQQEYVRSHVNYGMPSLSVKNKATHSYVLSRNEAKVVVLEQASEISKASDSVQWGHHLVTKKDGNLSHLISGMTHEGKEPSPWTSFNHFNKCNEDDANHKKTWSPRPHRSKKTTSTSLCSMQPVMAFQQNAKSLTLSFNQHHNPTSKMPHNFHDHKDKDYNKTSLGLFFGNPNYSFIEESELDDISGITRVDHEESFSLITDAYRTKKKIKVEDDSSARHCLAERKRREKLNKKFDELRAIVGPSLSVKTDKSSIIGAAIKLLLDKSCTQSLLEPKGSTIDNFTRKVVDDNKETSKLCAQSMSKVDKEKQLQDLFPSFQSSLHPHKTNPPFTLSEVFCDLQADFGLGTLGRSNSWDSLLHYVKVDAKQDSPQGRHYIISVRAPKRPDILPNIFLTLSRLELEVIFANSCIFANDTLSATASIVKWLLLKVEALEKSSSFNCNKCDIIHKAIKGCISEPQQ